MLFKSFIICIFLSVMMISALCEEETESKDDLESQNSDLSNDGDLSTAESFYWPWFYKPWFGYGGPYFKFKVSGGLPGYGWHGK